MEGLTDPSLESLIQCHLLNIETLWCIPQPLVAFATCGRVYYKDLQGAASLCNLVSHSHNYLDSRCLLSLVLSIFVRPTIFMSFNGRFHPRVVPGLSFCSSNFIMSFNRRLHPLSIFRLSSVAILIVRFFQIFFVFFLDSLHVLIIKYFFIFVLLQLLSLKIHLLFRCD